MTTDQEFEVALRDALEREGGNVTVERPSLDELRARAADEVVLAPTVASVTDLDDVRRRRTLRTIGLGALAAAVIGGAAIGAGVFESSNDANETITVGPAETSDSTTDSDEPLEVTPTTVAELVGDEDDTSSDPVLPEGEGSLHHVFVDGLHLVSSADGEWTQRVDPDSLARDPITGIDIGRVIIPADGATQYDEVCWFGDDSLPQPNRLTIDGDPILSFGSEAVELPQIGISDLTWEPRPGFPEAITATDVHVDAIREALVAAGLPDAADRDIVVDVATRTDLEGDGVDEVILESTVRSTDLYYSAIGDYSIVMLRRLDAAGEVENVVLGLHVTTGDEPSAEPVPESGVPEEFVSVLMTSFQLVNVIDLNGDGTMELLVRDRQFESGGFSVFDATVFPPASQGPVSAVATLSCGP